MNPEGTLIKIISDPTLAANSLVHGRAQEPKLTHTHNSYIHLYMHLTCLPGYAQHIWVCTHAKFCAYVQVPDYTCKHANLITHYMPQIQKAVYAYTQSVHIRAHTD